MGGQSPTLPAPLAGGLEVKFPGGGGGGGGPPAIPGGGGGGGGGGGMMSTYAGCGSRCASEH